MLNFSMKTVWALAMGMAMVLSSSSIAAAQSTQYDYVVGGMVNGSYYGNGSGYAAPSYVPQTYAAPTQQYASYYAPEYLVPRSAALIRLHVPANAEVFLSGEKTTQRGESRSYVTPPLKAGGKYAYHIKVRWTDAAGKVIEREKRLPVHPDDRLNVDFE